MFLRKESCVLLEERGILLPVQDSFFLALVPVPDTDLSCLSLLAECSVLVQTMTSR